MASPPFPVPIGMEWDPEKKRFFKSAPKGETSSVKPLKSSNLKANGKRKHTVKDESLIEKQAKVFQKLTFSHKRLQAQAIHSISNRHADDQLLMIKSGIPRLSHTSLLKKTLAVDVLGNAKHVRTASTDISEDLGPFRNRRLVGIHGLSVSDEFSSLLYFMSWNGFVYLIDTSKMNERGISHIALHLAELSWQSEQLQFQSQSIPISPTTLSFRSTMVDRLLIYAPNETPDCFSIEKDCFAFFTSPQELNVYKLKTFSSNLSLDSIFDHPGRSLKVSQDKYRIKIPKNWPSGGYITLNMKRMQNENCLIVCVGIGNRICLYRLKMQESELTSEIGSTEQTQTKLFKRVESDVISHDFSPSGRFVVVGCRNGKVARIALNFDVRNEQVERTTTVSPLPRQNGESFSTKVSTTEYLPFNGGIGAVTNVKHISEFEILLAYSSGKLITISLDYPQTPLRIFEGHINSWTLNPPMTIDLNYGVFAIAGQDRKVRIWSLDRCEPLGYDSNIEEENQDEMIEDIMQEDLSYSYSHKNNSSSSNLIKKEVKLSKIVFPNDITGLSFCQRSLISNDEARQNIKFLSNSLPSLAVSCGGSEIAFFE